MLRRNFLKLVGCAVVAPLTPVPREPLNCSCGCGAERGKGDCYTSKQWNEYKRIMEKRGNSKWLL